MTAGWERAELDVTYRSNRPENARGAIHRGEITRVSLLVFGTVDGRRSGDRDRVTEKKVQANACEARNYAIAPLLATTAPNAAEYPEEAATERPVLESDGTSVIRGRSQLRV